ncbi:MAG: M50 family metallopeptidase [Oscillospiraceae bacterium]|nr:M50 family metallopeptidase [Oscillospiraceae bacterium]
MKLHVSGGFWLVLAMAVLLFPIRFLMGVILAAAVHELGHLAALWLTGGRVLGMELHAGGARILADPMEPRKEIICALAGPAAGAWTILAWRVFPELAAAGLVQTLFNLLPVYPLDGGRALRNICCKRRDFGVQYGEHKDK